MADLDPKDSSLLVGITGLSSQGGETNPVNSTLEGDLCTKAKIVDADGNEFDSSNPLITSTTNGATEITALNQLSKLQNIEDTTYPIKNNTDSMKDSLLLVRDATQNLDTKFDSTLSSRASESTLSNLNNKIHQGFGTVSQGVRTASAIADEDGVPFTDNNPLPISNLVSASGAEGAIVVGTSAIEAKAGSVSVTNRRLVTVYNNSNSIIYWGRTVGVTPSTGTPIAKKQLLTFEGFPATQPIFLVADISGNDVRVTES